MKDVSTTLRTAYITAITSLTDLSGSAVTLYDRVPSTASDKYAFFGSFTSIEWTDKTGYGMEVTQTINVICQYTMNAGGQKEIDHIGNQIVGFIRTRTTLDLSPDFNMVTVTVDNINNSMREIDGGVEYLKSIRFRHLIKEL
jgi:hypothetical protein